MQWTESYAQTYTTVYAAPTPVDTTPKPAGWYPDPRGGRQRRYWDGAQWTEQLTEPEVVAAPLPVKAFVVAGVLLALVLVGVVAGGVQKGESEAIVVALMAVCVFGLVGWGIWLAFRSDAKRKERQQEQDRQRALAIQAEIQDAAFIQGDDLRGMYGEFPPPPEVLDDNR